MLLALFVSDHGCARDWLEDEIGSVGVLRDHRKSPCDVSVLDAQIVDRSRLHGPRQVTDAYLLALVAAHDGCFVTFDRSLSLASVPGATENHLRVL